MNIRQRVIHECGWVITRMLRDDVTRQQYDAEIERLSTLSEQERDALLDQAVAKLKSRQP